MALRLIELSGLALAAAGILLLVLSSRSRGGAAHLGLGPAPEPEPVARRSFLNRALVGSLGLFGAAFAGGSLGFVWPNVLPEFGKRIRVGKLRDIAAKLAASRVPYYNAEGRFYLVPYDTSDPQNRYVKAGVATGGIMALYQKCAHLGCRVPFCERSQWFECPCHQSKYNLAGEKMLGPAPAGLWRFPVEIDDEGIVFVDTSDPKAQPSLDVDTLHQPPAGPYCVSDDSSE